MVSRHRQAAEIEYLRDYVKIYEQLLLVFEEIITNLKSEGNKRFIRLNIKAPYISAIGKLCMIEKFYVLLKDKIIFKKELNESGPEDTYLNSLLKPKLTIDDFKIKFDELEDKEIRKRAEKLNKKLIEKVEEIKNIIKWKKLMEKSNEKISKYHEAINKCNKKKNLLKIADELIKVSD